MIGKELSHYRILATKVVPVGKKLGEGGMGVVYKAEDTKLNRTVALKFLPTNKLGSGEERQRFQQEAKAAAQLNHANIATVYEINEHDGQTFSSNNRCHMEDIRQWWGGSGLVARWQKNILSKRE